MSIFKENPNAKFFLRNVTIEEAVRDAEEFLKENYSREEKLMLIMPPIICAVPDLYVLARHGIRITFDNYGKLSNEELLRCLTILCVHYESELSYFYKKKVREDLCEKYNVSADIERDICKEFENDINDLYTKILNMLKEYV